MPYTAAIVERVFTCVPDRVIRLGGASWLRPMGGPTLPPNWERIRFGILCAVTPNGTSNISDVLFLLGLTATQTAPGSAYSTNNFLGLSVIGSPVTGSARLLTYTAGSGNPYYSCTGGVAFHKVNNTILTNSAASTAMLLPLARTGYYYRRTIVIVDITRSTGGAGNTTINVYCNTTAASAQTVDLRPDHLFEALDQPDTPVVRGVTLNSVLTTTAVNFSPVCGDVNTFEVFWSSSAFPLEISAIGATVIRPLAYTDVGFAEDTFEAYADGTVIPVELSSGSGWSAPGVIFSVQTYNDGSNTNSSNLAPQIYGRYAGTTTSPDETFAQYANGSAYNGVTINLGTYWVSPATFVSTPNYNDGSLAFAGNLAPQSYGQYVGTTNSPNDSFSQYFAGTVYSGTTLNQGTFWSSPAYTSRYTGLFTGSYQDNFNSVVYGSFAGTAYSSNDTFETYGTNSGSNSLTSVFAGGSYWGTSGTVYNTRVFFNYVGSTIPNFAAITGAQTLSGTAYNSYDTFEAYGTGAVVSGVTLVGGEFWAGAGSIY